MNSFAMLNLSFDEIANKLQQTKLQRTAVNGQSACATFVGPQNVNQHATLPSLPLILIFLNIDRAQLHESSKNLCAVEQLSRSQRISVAPLTRPGALLPFERLSKLLSYRLLRRWKTKLYVCTHTICAFGEH